MIRDPSPVLSLPNLRRIILSFNQIPVDQTNLKDQLAQAQVRGVYLNTRSQSGYRPKVKLVRSLIGHPQSNVMLGNLLREQGYACFIDLLLDNNIKEEDIDAACQAWEAAFKFDRSLSDLPFPGK